MSQIAGDFLTGGFKIGDVIRLSVGTFNALNLNKNLLIVALTATVATVAEGARSFKDIRESLGDWLPVILVVVAIGAAGWVIWTRVKQRRGGWA